MFNYVLYGVLLILVFMLIGLTYRLRNSLSANLPPGTQESNNSHEHNEKMDLFQGFIYAAIVLAILLMLGFTWYLLRGTVWEAHLMEWINIMIRLMHITFGIAWIGASFYFVFLENALNRTENLRDELAGNLWAIHGGGFYYIEKYKVAPTTIPKTLHWFKYEAYFTWLTGISLLFVVYYFNAGSFLIDTNVLIITPVQAIGIGVASLVVGWFLYHLLCKTPLVKNGLLFCLAGLIIATGFAWFYTHVFSGRGAFIHFGALLGTLMVGNVFFIIIPAQKAMVKAAIEGNYLDPALGKFAGLRSLHNNYLTLPVLFVMVSNHFPSTFGYKQSWIILTIITLGTAGIKHWLNLREKGRLNIWVLPVSIIILFAAAYLSAPVKPDTNCTEEISFTEVNTIVQKRCVSCHSSTPTDDVFKVAPNGVKYDIPQDIVRLKDKIMERVVVTQTMPQNNKTNITQAERDKIGCWIRQGALIK